MIRFNMPKLRIYQQILICFGLLVTVPLVGVTFIINNINQKAMKKEMARFTEHTAEALYRDFGTEISWQKQESQMMAKIMHQSRQSFVSTAAQIMDLDAELDVIGLYDGQGHLLQSSYRHFGELSPELRLPDSLFGGQARPTRQQPFQVIYFNTGQPQDSPYYLRAIIPITLLDHALARSADTLPDTVSAQPTAQTGVPAYYVQQKNFRYLQNMVRSNNSLYGAFYIIDNDGVIIAGPEGTDLQERIGAEDYAQFAKIRPGVTHEFSATAQEKQTSDGKDSDEAPPLEKVIVKMPDINWGIIIESPYHMKQKYIKWAGSQTFLLIAGCLLVILMLVLPYVLGISRNFRQLIKGVKAMGHGNYYRRIRLLTNFFTPYEIVYLTLEFNRMARKTADSWATLQEANRKLAQMDEFKSNLIDTVSHELRTPLTSIKGYTSRLLRYDHTLDAETRLKSLKVVKQQADRLSRLVEDLLVIPDLETPAGLRVYPDQVDLSPLLETSVQFIQAKEHRDISVQVDSSPTEGPLFVMADPDRLEQILLNLLDNAVKYSLPDTPIVVQVESTEQHRALTVINHCDPGPMAGLTDLNSLFDKFKRLDDSLIRTTRGSGLGLFITRGLVEAMGGSTQLTYENGCFAVRFTVPIYAAPPKAYVTHAELTEFAG